MKEILSYKTDLVLVDNSGKGNSLGFKYPRYAKMTKQDEKIELLVLVQKKFLNHHRQQCLNIHTITFQNHTHMFTTNHS